MPRKDPPAEGKPKKSAPKLVHAPVTSAEDPDTGGAAPGTGDMKKAEMLDLVAEATGAKKSDVRAVLEATLVMLGAALEAERTLKAPELGVLKVVKRKDTPGGPMLVCRLKRPGPKQADSAGDAQGDP